MRAYFEREIYSKNKTIDKINKFTLPRKPFKSKHVNFHTQKNDGKTFLSKQVIDRDTQDKNQMCIKIYMTFSAMCTTQ